MRFPLIILNAMATFLEAYDNYMEFSKGLVPMLEKLLHENKNMFEA